MKRKYFLFAIFALLISCISAAKGSAATSDKESKASELKRIEKQVAEEKENKAKLAKQAEELEEGMKGLRSELIEATSKVQKHENTLKGIEDKLAEVSSHKESLLTKLTRDKKSLADLILALERIRRLPPETLVARPDAPLETAQAATVLSTLLPEVNRRADILKANIADVQKIETELKDEQDKLANATEKLKKDKERMDALMGERSKNLKDTRKAVSAQDTKIANLSREAKDFRDLISRIEKQRKRDQESRTANTNSPSRFAGLDTNLPAIGTGQAPVTGIIKTRYGQTDDIGATSQGVTFQSRPGSVVVAPLGGIVRYAGDFRNYGNIILLEHKNNFHSLVAGLGKIDTFVGQRVDAGEPLGYLPEHSGRLYYELRKNGDPVNPSKKFSNLN
jgi:septal ring factor EnvC (AmiA/AmiB activator)